MEYNEHPTLVNDILDVCEVVSLLEIISFQLMSMCRSNNAFFLNLLVFISIYFSTSRFDCVLYV